MSIINNNYIRLYFFGNCRIGSWGLRGISAILLDIQNNDNRFWDAYANTYSFCNNNWN